jgi:hypothetical protein
MYYIYARLTGHEVTFVGCTQGDIPPGSVLLQSVSQKPTVHWVKWCVRFRRTLTDQHGVTHAYAEFFKNPARLNRLLADDAAQLAQEKLAGFLEFHRDNPDVLQAMISHALEERAAGRPVYSIREHTESVRWGDLKTDPGDDRFKINDHWSPWYSRVIQMEEPRLIGFFRLRNSIADVALVWKGVSWSDFVKQHADEVQYELFEELPHEHYEYN